MGYGGKYQERQRARELRAQSWTLKEICDELGVSKSSVSIWVRDVDFVPRPRNRGHPAGPHHPMRVKKEAEIAQCAIDATAWMKSLSDRDVTMFALGLYAGEGSKSGQEVSMANTNPLYLKVFVTWLRRTFDIDESRLRAVLYLHEGLDLDAASQYWSDLLEIPRHQFGKPYRAVADPSIRTAKHVNGCATARYSCALTARRVMAMIVAVSSAIASPG
jgi:hypothetical protein